MLPILNYVKIYIYIYIYIYILNYVQVYPYSILHLVDQSPESDMEQEVKLEYIFMNSN